MKKQFSAGIVIYYKKNDVVEYLILHYPKGHWDFPKGKIETGETHKEAALRELKEETGLEATIQESFKESFSYFFTDDVGERIAKTVYFFVGKAQTQQITLSHEHQGYAWLSFDEAIKQLTYQNAQDLLKKSDQFINQGLRDRV